jgi:hypothetical protein
MESLVYYLKQAMMNLQKSFRLILILSFALAVITACKKDEPDPVTPDSSPVQQLSRDDTSVEENMDEALIDAGQVLAGSNLKQGLPCGASLDSTALVNDTIIHYLTYDGLNCPETKYRKGKVMIKIRENTQWLFPNAFLSVHFIDYEVTNVFTSHRMVFNGISTLENISGGIPALLGNGFSTVIHRNTAHIQVAFNGHMPRDWHLTKMMVYSGHPGNLVLAVNGFGSVSGYSNLISWGTDREGKKFYTHIEEPVVFREVCQWLPYAGREVYTMPGINLKATASFGFNSNNEPVSGNECPTRYRLDWHQHGQSGTIFLPLYQ